MADRRVDGFFYGLFMDTEVLKGLGVEPADPRRAYVDDYSLRLGNRATLVPTGGDRSFGMVIALTRDELEVLYTAPGLEDYRPEAVMAHYLDGGSVPALCYNLVEIPGAGEANPAYAERLRSVLTGLGFPPEYVASV